MDNQKSNGSEGKHKYLPIREDWLELLTEDPIEPEQPIIDAHHHLWDNVHSRYLCEELLRDIQASGHAIEGTICVQATDEKYDRSLPPEFASVGETRSLAEITEPYNRPLSAELLPKIGAGISAYIDLSLGAGVRKILEKHLEVARGRLRGVRHILAWHGDPESRGSAAYTVPGLAYSQNFRIGLNVLAEYGILFEAWVYHTQLSEIIDLAHYHPALNIVLNHIGGPLHIGQYKGRELEIYRDWKYWIERLSEYKNVYIKLGGRGMALAASARASSPLPPTSEQLAEDWGGYFPYLIKVFGPERCMFESNFPVDKGLVSYGTLWNTYKRLASGLRSPQRQLLFYETARTVYRLELVDTERGRKV